MKKAFIILAYKDPDQIKRLVNTLFHKDFHFFIHVDKKFDIKPFKSLEHENNVTLLKERYRMEWASYRFIEVFISITEKILKKENYDFISTFSGQDYPLKNPNKIYNYYNKNIDKSFITIENENSQWYEECKLRYEKYHLTYFKFKGAELVSKILNYILPKRKFPKYNKIYGGPRATWLTLSNEAAKYLIQVINKNKRLNIFFKFTWAPDEFLIPTILMNSKLKEKIILDSGRYIDWSEGGYNPKVFNKKDINKLINCDKLYARKFDENIDKTVLDLIDLNLIHNKNN